MQGRHEGQVEVLVGLRAAGIAVIGVLHPLVLQIAGELVNGDELCSGLLADGDAIAEMVLVAVGQRHMGHPLGHVLQRNARLLEGGVAGEKGIDQDAACARVDAEAGMTEPRNLHHLTL